MTLFLFLSLLSNTKILLVINAKNTEIIHANKLLINSGQLIKRSKKKEKVNSIIYLRIPKPSDGYIDLIRLKIEYISYLGNFSEYY